MADRMTTVHFLDRNGHVSSYSKGIDESGKMFFECGDPPPSGAKVLDSEALSRIFRQRLIDERERHEASQARAKQVRKDAISMHKAKLATLVEGGISEEAAAIILGPEPGPFKPTEYMPKASATQNMLAHGLSPAEIDRVLGGWV